VANTAEPKVSTRLSASTSSQWNIDRHSTDDSVDVVRGTTRTVDRYGRTGIGDSTISQVRLRAR
jgi:hypothetical protein